MGFVSSKQAFYPDQSSFVYVREGTCHEALHTSTCFSPGLPAEPPRSVWTNRQRGQRASNSCFHCWLSKSFRQASGRLFHPVGDLFRLLREKPGQQRHSRTSDHAG